MKHFNEKNGGNLMYQSQKDAMILKIRKCSLIVGILCIASGVFNLVLAIADVFSSLNQSVTALQKIMLFNTVGFSIRAVIMLLAAVLFFSMFRSGRPFTPKKIRMVLLMAVMVFLQAAVSSVLSLVTAKIEIYKAIAMFAIQGGWMESVLFLFAALIMYYASLLQQESDETL